MFPAAPGRLSTITCWPHASESFCAAARASRSVVPPAGNGTTRRTGLVGYVACAPLANGAASDAITSASAATTVVVTRCMLPPEFLIDFRAGPLHDPRIFGELARDERRKLARSGR